MTTNDHDYPVDGPARTDPPRPRPATDETSSFGAWSAPSYGEPASGFDENDGRHSVPQDQPGDELTVGSYTAYLDDPPYARADGHGAAIDAGTPPRPSPFASTDAANTDTVAMPAIQAPVSATAMAAPPASMHASGAPATTDPGAQDSVTCPECGSTQVVNLSRRDSVDFCRRCDYPLFWTPSRVTRDRVLGEHSEALRRLPGAIGRSTLASASCPNCAERNLVSAETCIRCGFDMHPVAPPPPVDYVPPAPPPPVIEPEPTGLAWWEWALLSLVLIAAIALLVWAIVHYN